MIPSALLQAAQDPAIPGRFLAVYIALHTRLTYLEYRPLKVRQFAREVRCSKSAVADTLTTLLARGYLDRGPDEGSIRTYRLNVSPRSSCPV